MSWGDRSSPHSIAYKNQRAMDMETPQGPINQPDEPAALYRPSLINKLSRRVTQLPGPSASFYIGLGAALVIAQMVVLWVEGANPLQTFHIAQAFLVGAIAFMLASFQYFDFRTATAMSQTRPALTIAEAEYRELEFRLTTLPAGRPFVSAVVSIGILLLSERFGTPYWLEPLAPYPISMLFVRFIYIVSWGVFGVLVYQTLHRFALINRIYSQYTQINLFRKQPLYALSNLTAWMAVSVTILPIGFLLSNNITDLALLDPAALIVVVGIQLIAFLSFIWPQIGIRRLQREEKDRLLDEVNQRYEKAFLELHRRIDEGELDKTQDLHATLTLLEKELARVKRMSIWPWEPETVRWLITALILPIGVMILQLILQRVLGS